MKLPNRLQTIANMIDSSAKIYDVGCDHAYLDIYLASVGFDCVAIDVRKNVVDFAKKNVIESGYQEKVEVILNDNLNNIKIEDNDLVILSGLGTKTILNIIKDKPIKKLIVQSNDNLDMLRRTMMSKNYFISDEKIIFEDNKYYVIIKFEVGFKDYTDYELFLGPKLLQNKNSIFIKYLNTKLEHFNKVLLEIPSNYSERRNEIITLIEYIKMALK